MENRLTTMKIGPNDAFGVVQALVGVFLKKFILMVLFHC